MTSPYSALAQLSDDQLLAEVTRLAACERQATAGLVASLVVLDARRLYVREGYPSLFAYCTGVLSLAEGAAYLRIEAARAVRRLPLLLDRLASGAVTLTGIKLLAPHLTEANHLAVLEAARGKSTREIEQLAAQLRPLPDVPAVIRKLPARQVASNAPAPSSPTRTPLAPATASETPSANAAPPVGAPAAVPGALDLDAPAAVSLAVPQPRPAVVAPLAPERYKVQMTIGAETHERLCRARSLLRHAIPDGDLAAIFDRALVLLLEQLERQKWGARKARRETPTGDHAKRGRTGAEARKDRGRHPKDTDEARRATAGATEAGGGGPRVPAECGVVGSGEQGAGPAAGAPELVAKRVRAAHGHAVEQQPDTALSESKTGRRASRRIPAAVRRAVWLRANGRCAYVSLSGHRCHATSRLEFHHVVPYADGGEATVDGITLLCRAHHVRETERWFGERPTPGGNASVP